MHTTIFKTFIIYRKLETTQYIAYLGYLQTIWQHQNPGDWNKLTLPFIIQSCINSSPIESFLDNSNESKIDQLSPSSKSITAEKITISQEQAEDTSQVVPKPKNKIKYIRRRMHAHKPSTCFAQNSLKLSQPSLTSSQKTRTKETTPLPDNSPSKTSSESQGARPKETTSLLENSPSKTSSESQWARPKETTSLPENSPSKTSSESQWARSEDQEFRTPLVSRSKFFALFKSCLKNIVSGTEKRKATVIDYINNPKDDLKLNEAKSAFNNGPWHPELYFYLLEQAYEAGKDKFFSNRLAYFIENSYFIHGYPPHNKDSTKTHMFTRELISTAISYYYILADDVTPVEAIDSCLNNLCFITQEIEIQLSIADALRKLFGDQLFNHFFIDNDAYTDKLSFMPIMAPLSLFLKCRLMKLLQFSQCLMSLEIDSIYAIKNHPAYHYENFTGDYRLILGICTANTPTPLFLTSCLSKELTLDDIRDELVEQYNKKPLNEKFMKPKEWKMAIEISNFKYPYNVKASAITKHVLLQTPSGGRLDDKMSISINISKINHLIASHIKFMERHGPQHVQRSKEEKYRNKTHHHSDAIPDGSDAISEKTIKKQTESESESESINTLNKYISNAKTALRRHNNKETSENEQKLKEAFCTLRLYFHKIKDREVNIDNKSQRSYNDIVKKVENIL